MVSTLFASSALAAPALSPKPGAAIESGVSARELDRTRWALAIVAPPALAPQAESLIALLHRRISDQRLPIDVTARRTAGACDDQPADLVWQSDITSDATICLTPATGARSDGFMLSIIRAPSGSTLLARPQRFAVSPGRLPQASDWLLDVLETTLAADGEGILDIRVAPPPPGPPKVRMASRDRAGRVSVDFGPWQALPMEMPADGDLHRVVALVDGCSPRATAIRALPKSVELTCNPRSGRMVHVASTVTETRVLVKFGGDSEWQTVGVAGDDVRLVLRSPDDAPIAVLCISSAHLPWQRTIHARGTGPIRVVCRPAPIDTTAIVTTSAPQTRVTLDGHRLGALQPVSGEPPHTGLQPNLEYVVPHLSAGPHQLCAEALGHRRRCRGFVVRPAHGPVRIDFTLEPR